MTTTLTAVCSHEEDIKKSRFVAHAAPVSSIDEAMAFFAAHSDPEATHNCWAYRIGQEYRFNDDGEPGGTAFYTTNPNMALELGVLVFVVVVVGGLGSLEGAMIASLLIGLISSFSVGIDASLATLFGLFGAGEWAESVGGLMTVKISSLAATLPFLLMLVVLLVKPSGLKGEQA